MPARWFRVAANPLNLKVVTRAANTLGIHKAQALGHLNALWSWLADRTDDGSVVGLSDDEIEDAVEWTGTRGAFALFVRNRHVDKAGRIRDWEEFMGPLVKARNNARDRQRNHREKLKQMQDADADAGFGGGNSGPVTRDTNGRFVEHRDNTDVTRDIDHIRRDIPKNVRDRRTDIDLRKSIRTTGIYLGSELELVSSESRERELLKACSLKHPELDASLVQRPIDGVELVRMFCRKFYRGNGTEMLAVLQRLRGVLRPAGVRFQGQTIKATPELLVRAMNETIDNPPSVPAAAIVFVLKKLASGHLHEIRNADGQLVTEAMAEENRRLGVMAAEALADAGLGCLLKGMPVVRRMSDDERHRIAHALRKSDTRSIEIEIPHSHMS